MFKHISAGLLALSLAACQTTSTGDTASTIAMVISQAQATTRSLCAFVPTVSTIGNIIAAGNPGLQTAEAIASAICAAVGNPPAAAGRLSAPRRTSTPRVAGVLIQGQWVTD